MNTNWTPFWSDILTSSLWSLGKPQLPEEERERGKNAKLLFLTMIALANQEGFVSAAIDGLADQARLTEEETLEALKILESPDKKSRNKEHDGRRVEEVDGGWRITGYARHWERVQAEKRRAQLRIAQAKHRMKSKSAPVENKPDLVRTLRANARMNNQHADDLQAEMADEEARRQRDVEVQ